MPIKIKPVGEIQAKLGIQANGPIQKYFTNTCARHMDKYVPMDEGVLRQYKIVDTYIIYETPYAKYQYYGMRKDGSHVVSHYTTPGTGPYWDERMKSSEMKDIENEMQAYILHVGGK